MGGPERLISLTTPVPRRARGSPDVHVLWGIQDGSPHSSNDWPPILRLCLRTVNASAGTGRRTIQRLSP